MQKSQQKEATNSFDIVVDKLPYHVQATAVVFNDEKRFDIRVNGDEGHLFVWDPELVGLRALDDDSATLPEGLEKAISDKLVKTVVM